MTFNNKLSNSTLIEVTGDFKTDYREEDERTQTKNR